MKLSKAQQEVVSGLSKGKALIYKISDNGHMYDFRFVGGNVFPFSEVFQLVMEKIIDINGKIITLAPKGKEIKR